MFNIDILSGIKRGKTAFFSNFRAKLNAKLYSYLVWLCNIIAFRKILLIILILSYYVRIYFTLTLIKKNIS